MADEEGVEGVPRARRATRAPRRRRRASRLSRSLEFTPNVDPKELPLLSYSTVADINGQTEQIEDKHDAFVAFMGTTEGPGPLRTAEYDKMICGALLAAFGKKTTNSNH